MDPAIEIIGAMSKKLNLLTFGESAGFRKATESGPDMQPRMALRGDVELRVGRKTKFEDTKGLVVAARQHFDSTFADRGVFLRRSFADAGEFEKRMVAT